ncbi:MAG: hypothetical protein ACTS10_05555 [Kiloniellales bacterium]
MIKKTAKHTALALSVAGLATAAVALPAATAHAEAGPTAVQIASCTPCKPCAAANPCNPCAAANPCNPCAAAKNPCNPCAAANPCAAVNPCKPCNPCAAKTN